MKKKGFTPGQIITMLREAEVLLSQGSTAVEVVRKLGTTEQTYYRWRRAQRKTISQINILENKIGFSSFQSNHTDCVTT